jgi:hypothetical protein
MIFLFQYYFCPPNRSEFSGSYSHSYSQSHSRKFVMSADGKGYITASNFNRLNSGSLKKKLRLRIESKSGKK